jgi:2,4-dienoyl-CoA reductase-like NADH-dependent reductase (Old Yellow Enzyme family)
MSSSDIPITGKALTGAEYSDTPPKPMTVDQIKGVVSDFADAAKKCVEAGFDGVEIHG